jgi:hypothetical protein
MQIEDGVTIEGNHLGVLEQKFYRRFVIEDHLGIDGGFAFGGFACLDQALSIEQRIGVAFQAAGVPGKVDEWAIKDLLRVGSGRLARNVRCAA